MGRERIQLKKIEKAAARHVTFSKRRRGLIKKAQELSILCDADVGLAIFSATGKLFEYSNSSMKMILKKYSESSPDILNNEQLNIELENEDTKRIKKELENLYYTLRHMHGEDLQGLTIKELQKLEKMLEVGLRRIQSTQGNRYEEENARLHLKSSESIHNAYTSTSQQKTSIHHDDASNTSLQLGLSI